MTDEEKKAAYLEWINYLEDAEHDAEELPARIQLAINEMMRLDALPAGATGVTAESVSDLSRSFGAAQVTGLIPATVRRFLILKARTL